MTPEERIELLEREVKTLRGRLSVLEVLHVRLADSLARQRQRKIARIWKKP